MHILLLLHKLRSFKSMKITQKKLFFICNLCLFASAFIAGLSFVAQKSGMEYMGPFTFNAIRCFLGSICLLPLILFNDKKHPHKKSHSQKLTLIKGSIISGIILFIALSINQYAMIYSQAGKAGFITSLYIIFVPIISLFLKEKIKPNVVISIILSVIGLYLLCVKESLRFEFYDIFLTLSAFFFSIHLLVLSHYSTKCSTMKLSSLQFLTVGILSLPFMFIFETPLLSSILAGYKPLLFAGVIVTGVAYTLQLFGYKAVKPVLATLILSSEAIFAVLGGMVLLNETLNFYEFLGCILMASAIILSQIDFKNIINRKNMVKEIVYEKVSSKQNV